MTRQTGTDPFGALGLEPQAGLTDDEVHAAWRRVAAATHPDREDGGEPERFAAAAAAYTALRTRFGRGEVLADIQARAAPARPARRRHVHDPFPQPQLWSRVRRGRPARLALRLALAIAAGAAALTAAGPHPAAPALITGIATWLALTARHDLTPPGPR